MAATTAHSIHLHAQVISRAGGRSATAAAAYRIGARIADERTGEVHDYRRKGGVVYSETLVPVHAPERYRDPESLWNAVELSERAQNSQLAREFNLALPRELSRDQNIELAREYVREQFVGRGMCATWAYHDPDHANHNPHVHVMCTMREVREDGSFEPKAHKEYLVRFTGTEYETYMSARDLKVIRENKIEGWDGDWEKVYKYRLGNEYRNLTPSEAKAWEGCKRVGKDAIDRKVDANDWNQPERVEEWRSAWSDALNAHLARAGVDKSYDHRSFARREVDQVPQVHMGVEAFNMEHPKDPNREPVETVRGEQNRQIETLNKYLVRDDLPQHVRDEVADRAYGIREGHFEDVQDVRERAKPAHVLVRETIKAAAMAVIREARERAAGYVRSAADRVLANPLCRTMVGFVRDMRERKGVDVSRGESDLTYRYDGMTFTGTELGGRYAEASLVSEMEERNQPRRRAGRAHDFVKDIIERETRERNVPDFGYKENGYLDVDREAREGRYAALTQREDRSAERRNEERDGILAMGRNGEEMVADRAGRGAQEQNRNKNKGHGHDVL